MRKTFKSMEEIREYLQDIPVSETRGSTQKLSKDFCRFSWDETLKALVSGSPELGNKVIELSDAITGDLVKVENTGEFYYDLDPGDCMDIGKYMQGEPEVWFQQTTGERPAIEVKIAVNLCLSGCIEDEVIIRRGAAVMALIDALKRRKYAVKVIPYYQVKEDGYSMHSNDGDCITTIEIDTRNDFSRDALAFILCNPGFCRRIIFAVEEKLYGKENLSGYGCVDTGFKYLKPDEGIEFPALMGYSVYGSNMKTIEEIKRVLQKYTNSEI